MLLTILKSKIHRAKVTQADLNYVGSITIDEDLLRQSGINEYEQVDVVDINNGNRLTTYAIAGKPGSGYVLFRVLFVCSHVHVPAILC